MTTMPNFHHWLPGWLPVWQVFIAAMVFSCSSQAVDFYRLNSSLNFAFRSLRAPFSFVTLLCGMCRSTWGCRCQHTAKHCMRMLLVTMYMVLRDGPGMGGSLRHVASAAEMSAQAAPAVGAQGLARAGVFNIQTPRIRLRGKKRTRRQLRGLHSLLGLFSTQRQTDRQTDTPQPHGGTDTGRPAQCTHTHTTLPGHT